MRPRFLPPFASAALALALAPAVAHAAPPEPAGPHPRLFLDDATLAAIQAAASRPGSAVARAITLCDRVHANPGEYSDGGFQGLYFAERFGACALAYKATGDATHGEEAVRFFRVLLNDRQTVGDGAGGDDVVHGDSGFAMRAFGPYTAIAYDWLHDAPGVDDDLRALARQRFKAWTDWYPEGGYNPDVPGSNYQAGYLFGATLIAVAQGGEAGADGAALWTHVVDVLFGQQMAAELEPGGRLDGGDWLEGWQYGNLSVLEYAAAARALRDNGAPLTGYAAWEGELVARMIYASVPAGGEIFVGGDADLETPYRELSPMNIYAALIDAGPDEARAWAQDLFERFEPVEPSFLLLAALAEARAPAPVPFPTTSSTWYVAEGSSTMYARTAWRDDAVWMVTRCMPGNAVPDHMFFDAGNVVLSRGADHLIVDPSPYGTMSTLTGNAPTVASATLPDGYAPGQGPWGGPDEVHYQWRRQTAGGVVAARCEYAGQYRFRDEAPDVDRAVRDVVMVPTADGTDATLVTIDHAAGGAGPLEVRFRTQAALTAGAQTTGTLGDSRLTIQLASGSGTPGVRDLPVGDCFSGQTRGNCDAARFAGDEWRVQIGGPVSHAMTVVDATAAAAGVPAPATVTTTGDVDVIGAERGGRWIAVVAAATPATGPIAGPLTYRTRGGIAATHVVVDAPRGDGGRSDVTVRETGGDCEVTVTARGGDSGGFNGAPLVMLLDAGCNVTEDPALDPFGPPTGIDPDPGESKATGGGCCGVGSSPTSLVLAALLAPVLLRRRRRGAGATA